MKLLTLFALANKKITVLATALLLLLTTSACSTSGSHFDDTGADGSISDNPTDTDTDTDTTTSTDTTTDTGTSTATGPDTDQDGVLDTNDNCIEYINSDQNDNDGDGAGDVCDADDDNDGIEDVIDQAPFDSSISLDSDNDGLQNLNDNCPAVANVDQLDTDADLLGNACDGDDDGDGTADSQDAFPLDATETADTDGDGVGNNSDNCVSTDNTDQTDTDADTFGNACDDDDDGDGALDTADAFPTDATETTDTDNDGTGDNSDNCATKANADQTDTDADGMGDECDDDKDNDGFTNDSDNCPLVSNADQADADGDLIGDVCDDDADGDGFTIDAGDCDDTNELVYTGATEIFDLVDNDCDTTTAAEHNVSLSLSRVTITGATAEDQFGKVVSRAGDVNGDGINDFLVSAPLNDDAGSAAGKVYLFYGSETLVDMSPVAADVTYTGESSGDRAGWSVAGLGDINGDSFDDFAIGAYQNDSGGSNAGKVYIVYGSSALASISLGDAAIEILGEDASDYLGYAVSAAGDVNGDGFSDILLGAYGDDTGGSSAGRVYLIYGSASLGSSITLTGMATDTGLSFAGESAGDTIGKSIAAGHDLDNDGFSDIILGAAQNDDTAVNAGKTYIVYGSDSLADAASSAGVIELKNADAAFTGIASNDVSGTTLAAGDLNGDGFAEIAIGAYRAGDYAGAVSVFYGSATRFAGTVSLNTASATFAGDAVQGYLGYAFDIGELNSDGYADLFIAAPEYDALATDAGKAYLWLGSSSALSGSVTLTSATSTVLGESRSDDAGSSVALVGDINGDGYGDSIVSAPRNDEGGVNAGEVYINFGGDTP